MRGDPLGDNSSLMNPLMEDQSRLMTGFGAACCFDCVDETRMAAIGYCFGGLCALDLARAGPKPPGRDQLTWRAPAPAFAAQLAIGASILLLHGWEDPIVPPADVLAITRELTAARADWQLHVYGHARHAFTFEDANAPERCVVFDPMADRRSWAAMRFHLDTALHRRGRGGSIAVPEPADAPRKRS